MEEQDVLDSGEVNGGSVSLAELADATEGEGNLADHIHGSGVTDTTDPVTLAEEQAKQDRAFNDVHIRPGSDGGSPRNR